MTNNRNDNKNKNNNKNDYSSNNILFALFDEFTLKKEIKGKRRSSALSILKNVHFSFTHTT